jgi:predicted Zn finger-like uncharacterized protein
LYTRCPHCLTVFVVAAEQLKAAHGNVRCGTCLESFDAIPHLSDGPVQTRPTPAVERQNHGFVLRSDSEIDSSIGVDEYEGDDEVEDAGDNDNHSDDDNARIASARLTSTLDAARAAASQNDGDTDARGIGSHFASDQSAAPAGVHAGPGDKFPDDYQPDTELPQNSASAATRTRLPPSDASELEAEPPLPEVLRLDAEEFAARAAARRRTIGYGIGALALLVLLAGQYVFFMPEDAARRYPQWRGAIESVCVQVGCILHERRDPTRIRVVSRDVRVHPKYEGVMQIKATLTNSAPYRQPYPRVRFTLFNVNGQTIATRVFQPREYLGRPVDAGARVRPKTPFQVELDVLAPEEAAVSFEFSFM